MEQINPFHEGELKAQARAGVGDVAKWAGGFIRDYLPEQHREFHTNLPFLVVSGADGDGKTWVTLMEGAQGFATSPDPRRLELSTALEADDPLAEAFSGETDIGVLGIELATRRRNRFSGRIVQNDDGYVINVRQTFGNCPQYIHERAVTRVSKSQSAVAKHHASLTTEQITMIGTADTMFIGSGHQGAAGSASNGYDASHRGGAPGFVQVVDATHLQIPDYAGNNFFNTIGNILSDPRIGLLFVDFETGGLLHITGRANIDWDPRNAKDDDAWRSILVEIDAIVERPGAVGLRWTTQDHVSRSMKLTRREEEAAKITSFYFEPVDGQPLALFEAGQHLPIDVQIPGQSNRTKRSYSLSGAVSDGSQYRLTVKREDSGLMSRFLHDHLQVGDVIRAQNPSGDFVIPCGDCPLVLVSAGVGLTPMVSMLHATAHQKRPVWFVHGARNGQEHALQSEVNGLVVGTDNIRRRVYYSRPQQSDVPGRDYDAEGRLTAEAVLELNAGPDARYMLCGPAAFLGDMRNGLEAGGVPADHIHFETFGPSGA